MKKLLFSALVMCATALSFIACSPDNDDESEPKIVSPTKMEAVDLGLPSGTKWCNMNVGATIPTEFGNYYSWGEVETKESYSYDYEYKEIGTDIAGTRYDAAFQTEGQRWIMPSKAQFDELIEKCTWEWTTTNGANGYTVTGPNGSKIFLPAAGEYNGGELSDTNESGLYWTSSLTEIPDHMTAYALSFGSDNKEMYATKRSHGMVIRAVLNPVQLEAVDLALPSGTKWCNMNVGSAKPEIYGGYFAWGDTVSIDSFNAWKSNDYNDYIANIITEIGNDMAGTEYDAASKILGNSWRTPTMAQFEELIKFCDWTWTTQNGINGYTVTGSNNNSIFLPACGDWFSDNPRHVGMEGVYLISNLDGLDVNYFYFRNESMDFFYDSRAVGRNIRAVYVER